VSEGVRDNVALTLFLQSIIADRRSRLKRRFHVPRFDELPFSMRAVAADIASAEASLEILKETRVEVNFLIKAAIERTHSRLRKSAT
jgi:hypothetical protein